MHKECEKNMGYFVYWFSHGTSKGTDRFSLLDTAWLLESTVSKH